MPTTKTRRGSSSRSKSSSSRKPAARRAPQEEGHQPRAGDGGPARGRRPGVSSPATGPTCSPCACSCWGRSSPSASGPTSPVRWARRSPTAPVPCSVGPGSPCRWSASPSAWCCSGPGGAADRRRRPTPTPSRRRRPGRGARPSASPSARSCSSSPTSASSTSPTGVPRSAVTSTPCATPAARSGPWSAGPLVAATGVAGASLILGARRGRRRPARARPLDRRRRRRHRRVPRAAAAAKARDSVKLAPIGEGVDVDAAAGPRTVLRPSTTRSTRTPTPSPSPASHPSSCPSRSPNRSRPHFRPRRGGDRDPGASRTRAVSSHIDLGDDVAAHKGPWKLPPANLLKRGSGKEADRRVIDDGGQHPRGHARAPRCRGQARRHHDRPDRHPLRARARRRA